MEPEQEIHLINQNQQLKKRIKETEELFGQMDDDYQIRIKELMSQKQSLTAKNTALESRLLTLSEENAELAETVENLQKLANAPQQPNETQSNFMSESFVSEYTELQDKVDGLNEDKITLQSKIRKLENDVVNMVQRMESLEATNAELTEALSSVNKEKTQLSKENKQLAESVTFLQMQLDTMSAPKVDQKERGNSLFGEVDEAREKAEEELRKVVEQNVLLQSEIEALQIRLRRYAHSNLTHADQVEIEFQKKHSEQIFSQLQEYMKQNERYAQQIEDLNNKLISLQNPASFNESVASVIVKRQLEIATKELGRLRKIHDEQSVQLNELGLKALEIPALKASIKRYENKVASLEDELKMLKELQNINNKASLTSKPNNENVAPRLNLFEVPITPQESRSRPRLVSPSKTQPSKAPPAQSSWASRLKNDYKQSAREHRERSLDFRRGSRLVSIPKDPKP